MVEESDRSHAEVLQELKEAKVRLESVEAQWKEYRSEEKLRDREAFREDVLLAWLQRDGKGGVWSVGWKQSGETKYFREWVHEFAKGDKRFMEYASLLGERALADDLELRREFDQEKTSDEID